MIEPLTPERKWRAITLATLVLAPAVWSLLAGLVAVASDDTTNKPAAGLPIAFGLAALPFAFVVLAFASQHPRAPSAVLRAMGLSVLVAIPVSALAGDAVTGLIAGIGAGGVVALRADADHDTKLRAGAVAIAAVYCFVLARTAGPVVLIAAPFFPFTGLGLADHLAEWRIARLRSQPDAAPPIG